MLVLDGSKLHQGFNSNNHPHTATGRLRLLHLYAATRGDVTSAEQRDEDQIF